MKKLFTISLAFLYLLISSGLLVEIHHCMGRIADATLHLVAHEPRTGECGKCGMPKSDESEHCCKDEIKLVKLDSDQKPASLAYQIGAPVAILEPMGWPQLYTPILELREMELPKANAPPPDLPSRQVLYCVFRI